MSRVVVSTLMVAALAVAGLLLVPSAPVSAGCSIAPCDFITGGGFIFRDDGERANFGSHGGCKKGGFSGARNYVEHGGFNQGAPPPFVSTPSTRGPPRPAPFPTARPLRVC